VAVIVVADGPLPLPTVGVLGGPPRIYLDFRNVTTATTGIRGERHPVVRRVRVALKPGSASGDARGDRAHRAARIGSRRASATRELTVIIGAPAGVQSGPPSPQVATPHTPARVAPPAGREACCAAGHPRSRGPPPATPRGRRRQARSRERPASGTVVAIGAAGARRRRGGGHRGGRWLPAVAGRRRPRRPARILPGFPRRDDGHHGNPRERHPVVRRVRVALNQLGLR